MKFRKIFILILLGFFPFLASGDIVSDVNPNTLKSKIEYIIKNQASSDILVIWNTDMFLSRKNKHTFDNNIKILIQQLQNQGIKMMGITSTLTRTNPVSKKRYIFEYRDMLQKQGVDFAKSYPKDFLGPVSTFFNFPRTYQYYPMFYHGILSFNSKQEPMLKAEVLRAFLFAASVIYEDKVGRKGYYPKIIIWINDQKEDLIQAKELFKKLNKNLTFKGILVDKSEYTMV